MKQELEIITNINKEAIKVFNKQYHPGWWAAEKSWNIVKSKPMKKVLKWTGINTLFFGGEALDAARRTSAAAMPAIRAATAVGNRSLT
jgi:hypothetical protein